MSNDRDLLQRIAAAGRHIAPSLSDRDVERLLAEVRRKRDRRERTLRAVLAAGAAVSLIAAGGLVARRVLRPPFTPAVKGIASVPEPAADRILRLSDGSTAVPLDAATELELVEERPDRVRLSLLRGRGRFEVTPRPKRSFVVRAGDVTVTVVGTAFTVERVADRIGVAVQRGTVRVEWGAGSALVREGQSGWYPPLVTTAAHDRPLGTPRIARVPRAPGTKTASLSSAPLDKGEAAADLLLAADRARLAGHANEGAELLRKLLREHADDPRAPLAAFTLGRLLLIELRRPVEAAAAFAQVRSLSPDGPFAEDSLAREVEALSKAGRATDARALADEYGRLYPNGRRAATVRAAGGIK